MSINKSIRKQLEKIYGRKCMIHEGIRTLKKPKPIKVKYRGKSIANQLTLHHLIPKSKNGPTTIENGILCCRMCHDWIEQLSEEKRRKINEELRNYKRSFDLGIAELTTEGIKHVQKIKLTEVEEYAEILVEEMTSEEWIEYKKHKEERNKRVFRKFEEFEK